MIRPRSAAVTWLLLGFIIFATVSPAGLRPRDLLPADIDRGLALILMTAAFNCAYPEQWLRTTLLCVASAFAIEILQSMAPGRDPHIEDAIVKAFGALLGGTLGFGLNLVRLRLRWIWGASPQPVYVSLTAVPRKHWEPV